MSDNAPNLPNTAGPLAGVRVVEVAVWHAGPGAGAILADLGADVIKVETIEGDPERFFAAFAPMTDTRGLDKPDWTVMFDLSNRGKRAISLDLKQPDGVEVLHRLVEKADVFVSNLRTPTKKSIGIDYETLRKVNERIVHINVTGFGAEGPLADAGAFDNVGQAMSGMMFTASTREPQPLQVMVMDQLAAIAASHAAVTALLARELHGHGQEVNTSLYGAGTWLMYGNLGFTGARGEAELGGDRTERTPLRNLYRCGDGEWIMGTNHPEQKHWPTLCTTLGLDALVDDPRFATVETRHAALPELYHHLDAAFATRSREEWLKVLTDAGLFFAPIKTFADVLDDEQALANGYVADQDHPILGRVRQPGFPMRFSRHTVGARGAAPRLAEHSREILEELGYGVGEIQHLTNAGAVKLGDSDD